jgi:hypothetical protein
MLTNAVDIKQWNIKGGCKFGIRNEGSQLIKINEHTKNIYKLNKYNIILKLYSLGTESVIKSPMKKHYVDSKKKVVEFRKVSKKS